METSRRRSPSIINLATSSRIRTSSCSERSFTLREDSTPDALQISRDRVVPIPNIAFSAIFTCLLTGRLTPAIRTATAILNELQHTIYSYKKRLSIPAPTLKIKVKDVLLTLPLLVTSLFTDDSNHPFAAHHFTMPTQLLNRCSNLHNQAPLAN